MKFCLAHAGDVSDPSGGTDRVTAIAKGLDNRGHDVVVVVPEAADQLPERLNNIDVREVSPPMDNAVVRVVAVARKSLAIARSEDRRLQVEHSVLGGIASVLDRDVEFVLDMHDLAFSRFDHVGHPLASVMRFGVRLLERRAVNAARHIVLVSENMARIVESEWDTPSNRLSVVPNGYFPTVIEQVTDVEQVPGRVVFLGTLHPKVDVQALCRVAELDEVQEVLVIGDGAQREQLETESHRYEKLEVLGRLPDEEAFRYVASAATVVNPQDRSALQRSSSPVKLYYYAALGKPIVATRGPSILDELREKNAARAVTDTEGFVNTVQNLLEDDALASELGANASKAADEFQWENRTETLTQIHQNLNI